MKREISTVQNPVVEYARTTWGIMVTKGGGVHGMFDTIFWITGGKPLLMEFKDPDGEVSPTQEYWHSVFKKWGYDVEICSSSKDGKRIIANRMEPKRVPKEGHKVLT